MYIDEQATPAFWDAHWETEGAPRPVSKNDEVRVVTRKYLPQRARILEGGCGRGHKAQAMAEEGYEVVGVDFGARTVESARANFPSLDIRTGDVRSLEFPDEYFDGYWSIGVIEHFWNGYDAILQEAARVLKVGGFLFLTAPWFSPYRMRKARRGHYPVTDYEKEPGGFYQFALGRREIVEQLQRCGFQLVMWRGIASEIALREDALRFSRLIDYLYGSRGSIFKRVLRKLITPFLNRTCGHSFLAVARRVRPSVESSSVNAKLG